MYEVDVERVGGGEIPVQAFELSQGREAGRCEENRLRAERELTVEHEYDTVDRDLEQLGMTVSRLPSEAGVVWRLCLPRGERFEAWEPGNGGLAPPAEIARLIDAVAAGKPLVPAPPLSADPGVMRLREMIGSQRRALLVHDPGVRLGEDSENLHEHRVAARRIRAYLRAVRQHVDPAWRRSLAGPLAELGEATGPVRDLDVLMERLREELRAFEEPDRGAGEAIVASLELEREDARQRLLEVLDGNRYRAVLTRLRLPPRLAPGVDEVPLRRLARRQFRSLLEAVDQLGDDANDDALHALRIALKRSRYTAELSHAKGTAVRRFLVDARALQALLGDYQDAVVAEQQLRALAVNDARTAAAFVAGRIVERQRARRARVAKRLPAALKQLRKSGARLR
ncbi:MAG: CHAD domain-containing protein [Solirubrobacteraceae bacterium]